MRKCCNEKRFIGSRFVTDARSSLIGKAPKTTSGTLPLPERSAPGDILSDSDTTFNSIASNVTSISDVAEERAAIMAQLKFQPDNNDEINIEEKLYVNRVLEIYSNPEAYVGKQIRIQGMLAKYHSVKEKRITMFSA